MRKFAGDAFHPMYPSLPALLLTVSLACAQGPVGLDATLKAPGKVLRIGQKLALTLVVAANKDTEVDATILAGTDLETTVEGKAGPAFKNLLTGKVKLAAGTRIERALPLDLGQIAPNVDPGSGKLAHVTVTWPGLAGAAVAIDVAPDLAKVDVALLDLEKTQVMLLTNHGPMTVKFLPNKARKHVENFVKLSKDGFYDGTKFHRIYKGFMIQGGCPNTKEGAAGLPGTGNPGYMLAAEFNDTKHVRGVLSMARGGDPNSAGCQFFVMHEANPGLDGAYTAFGMLEAGFDTLDKICDVQVKPQPGTGELSAPVEPVHLHAAIVLPVFKK